MAGNLRVSFPVLPLCPRRRRRREGAGKFITSGNWRGKHNYTAIALPRCLGWVPTCLGRRTYGP